MTAEDTHKEKLAQAFRRFLDGWGVTTDSHTAAKFAETISNGDEKATVKFMLPRDVRESAPEYVDGKIRHARLDLLRKIDDAGAVPAGPITETVRHFSWQHGHAEVPPEADEWDNEEITLSCRVWKLREE